MGAGSFVARGKLPVRTMLPCNNSLSFRRSGTGNIRTAGLRLRSERTGFPDQCFPCGEDPVGTGDNVRAHRIYHIRFHERLKRRFNRSTFEQREGNCCEPVDPGLSILLTDWCSLCRRRSYPLREFLADRDFEIAHGLRRRISLRGIMPHHALKDFDPLRYRGNVRIPRVESPRFGKTILSGSEIMSRKMYLCLLDHFSYLSRRNGTGIITLVMPHVAPRLVHRLVKLGSIMALFSRECCDRDNMRGNSVETSTGGNEERK
jgi:hypothetical protein